MINLLKKIDVFYINSDQFSEYRRFISDIYREAFAQPPYNEGEGAVIRFTAALERHLFRQGFRCIVARPYPNHPIVGFAFGYTAQPGQWWHDTVASVMNSEQVKKWLSDCFELAELAVKPSFQGLGIGGRLHDNLMADLPHRTAALSTINAESNALYLYRNRGWVTLVKNLKFSGGLRNYKIMGLDLCNSFKAGLFANAD